MDFVADRTHDGRPLKLLTIVDECTRESLDVVVERSIRSMGMLECPADLFKETKVLVAMWRDHYNHVRPHSALGYKPPAPAARLAALTRDQKQELTSVLTD